MFRALEAAPANLAAQDGRLLAGLWAGQVRDDPVSVIRQRGGRVRRWAYAAAAGTEASAGAAVVDIGVGGTVFVWVAHEAQVWTWEHTAVGGRGITVPDRPDGNASASVAGGRVVVGGDGSLRATVTTEDGTPVRIDVAGSPVGVGAEAAVCATPTPRGGWNVTQKRAGHATRGTVEVGRQRWRLDGAGWTDWTAGRQDRRTEWRWAAGAGTDAEGRRVGLNASTGMNGRVGEDVVWWDGVPYRLPLDRLEPVERQRPEGAWRLAGDGWELRFETEAVRAADENLLLLRSWYVQPIGRFRGTLPGPGGVPAEVAFPGVTEDHRARW